MNEKERTSADSNGKTLTILGKETVFQGTINFTDDLVIAGKFQGLIEAEGNLEIAKTASCSVERIAAKSVKSYGVIKPLSVEGDDKARSQIDAPELVELCAGSDTVANITTKRIRIEDDASLLGAVDMASPDGRDIFSLTSQEYRDHLVASRRGVE